MKFSLQVNEAFLNLTTSKLRSFLALLGILVGTASVVAMVSGGKLATQAALQQIKVLGTNLLSVSMYGNQSGGDSKAGSAASPIYLSLSDTFAMPQSVKGIQKVGPYTQVYLPVSFNGRNLNASIMGVTQDLAPIAKITTHEGRFISNLDGLQMNCMLGQGVASQINQYYKGRLIGRQVRLGDEFCTVVGIANKWPQNSFLYTDINNSILVPVKTSFLLSKYVNVNNIVFRVDKGVDFTALQERVKKYIEKHSSNLHLYFRSPQQLLASAKKQSDILTVFLGFIGGISLLVGGIGVMNIMLVSVVERKREIGIRMAVGARRIDIQSLFLIESIVLALCGGIAGVILGVFSSYVIAVVKHWHFVFYSMPPLIGFSVSVLIGVFFGFYPAHKASKLNPIDALRSE